MAINYDLFLFLAILAMDSYKSGNPGTVYLSEIRVIPEFRGQYTNFRIRRPQLGILSPELQLARGRHAGGGVMVWYLRSQPVGGHYPDFEALDGDTMLIECLDMSQDDGVTIRPGIDSAKAGRPLKSLYIPTKIEWRSDQQIADIESPYISLAVTDRFREIVEQREPGVHQWFPVEFVDRKGQHLADRWYFIPCNRIDSVDRVHTTLAFYKHAWRSWRVVPANERPSDYDPDKKPKVVFSFNKAKGYHAWRDKYIDSYHLLISDELANALAAEIFTGISLTKAETV